jgi:hypothetical protein
VRVRVAAAGLNAQPAERPVAAPARHRDATVWIRVAEHLAGRAAEVQGLVELWLHRLGSARLSLVWRLCRLHRLEVEPQGISEEEGLDHAAAKGEGLLVGAETVEGAIQAAHLCRASEAADVPLKACRADQVAIGAGEPAVRADLLEADEAPRSRGGRSIVQQRNLVSGCARLRRCRCVCCRQHRYAGTSRRRQLELWRRPRPRSSRGEWLWWRLRRARMLWRRRRRAWRTLWESCCRRCACARGRTRSRRWSVWRRLRRGGWCRHGQAHCEVWSQRSITRSAGLVQRNLPSSGSRTRLRCHRSSRLCVAHGSFRVCHGFHRARSKSKREGTICSLLCLRSKSEQKENAKRAPSRILELYTPPGFMCTHELNQKKRHLPVQCISHLSAVHVKM